MRSLRTKARSAARLGFCLPICGRVVFLQVVRHPIASLNAAEARALLPQFLELLHDAIDSGASIGFLPPKPKTY